jgi:hypothetical protein
MQETDTQQLAAVFDDLQVLKEALKTAGVDLKRGKDAIAVGSVKVLFADEEDRESVLGQMIVGGGIGKMASVEMQIGLLMNAVDELEHLLKAAEDNVNFGEHDRKRKREE